MAETAKAFFTASEKERLKMAIKNAELETSGEIRLHLESVCKGDVMDRAAQVFAQLDMHKTELRNGVLVYLAISNRKFAVLGDKGINAVVTPTFWDEIKANMILRFRDGLFTEGLCEAIEAVGMSLKKHFPRQRNDVNELPDDLSFGKN
jgi:uncharacterized membrane protein